MRRLTFGRRQRRRANDEQKNERSRADGQHRTHFCLFSCVVFSENKLRFDAAVFSSVTSIDLADKSASSTPPSSSSLPPPSKRQIIARAHVHRPPARSPARPLARSPARPPSRQSIHAAYTRARATFSSASHTPDCGRARVCARMRTLVERRTSICSPARSPFVRPPR